MFAPEYIERQRHVNKWVRAAMVASVAAVDGAMAGVIPVDSLGGVLDSILENAVKEVMKFGVNSNTKPSVN